jgi:hypothetical protein
MKKECTGNLKEIILAMIEFDTNCCEVTNTVGDISVSVDITITKITNGDEVLYDVADGDEELEFVSFDEDDIEYLS